MSDYKVVLDQDTVLNVSINLSKIPPDYFKQNQKGDTYLAINVTARKDGADTYGNDLNVFLNKTKEQKEADIAAGVKTRYCGNGKSVRFQKDGGTPMTNNPWANNANAGQPQGQQQPQQQAQWFSAGQPVPDPTQQQNNPPAQQQPPQQQQQQPGNVVQVQPGFQQPPQAGFNAGNNYNPAPDKADDLPF